MPRRLRILWKLTLRDMRKRKNCQHTRMDGNETCLDCGHNPWLEAW